MPPVMGRHTVSDPHIESLKIESVMGTRYLQTSPEFAMKKLLAVRSEPIYSLGQVFRAGEHGRKHRQEFTMLEWYRPGYSLTQLEAEITALLMVLAEEFSVPFSAPDLQSYAALFSNKFGVNPHQATDQTLRGLLNTSFPDHAGHLQDDRAARNDYLDALFSLGVEPDLQAPTFVREFPATQAALAKTAETKDGLVALRTELYWHGVELANGYDELQDGEEYRRRIEMDNATRELLGYARIAPDESLITAINHLPDCAGVALGIDRLLMLLLDSADIAGVTPFAD